MELNVNGAVTATIRKKLGCLSMDSLVDKIMAMAPMGREMTRSRPHAELRKLVSTYIELLWSAGKRDPEELSALGREYLRKVVHRHDPKYSGC